MNEYNDSLKVKDALQVYFSKYHFADGGYNLKWFKIKLGPVSIPLPNIKSRVAAVKIHDLHHLVTEYKADLRGEAQIGAWEIASGCGKYLVAWILNFASFTYGIIFFPHTLLTAFLNGKTAKTNFYYGIEYNDELLNKTVGELREHVRVHDQAKNSAKDYFLFALWALLSISSMLVFFFMIYRAIVWVVMRLR